MNDIKNLVALIKAEGKCHPKYTPLIEVCDDCPLSDGEGICRISGDEKETLLEAIEELKMYSEEEVFEAML